MILKCVASDRIKGAIMEFCSININIFRQIDANKLKLGMTKKVNKMVVPKDSDVLYMLLPYIYHKLNIESVETSKMFSLLGITNREWKEIYDSTKALCLMDCIQYYIQNSFEKQYGIFNEDELNSLKDKCSIGAMLEFTSLLKIISDELKNVNTEIYEILKANSHRSVIIRDVKLPSTSLHAFLCCLTEHSSKIECITLE